jgi:hypothetical protein
MGVRCGSPGNHTSGSGLSSCRLWRPNPSLKLTRLSPRLYLGGWAESEAGQREVSGKLAAQLSSTVGQRILQILVLPCQSSLSK